MHEPDGDAAAAPSARISADGVTADGAESLRLETQAAVGAVTAHLRKVAATASTEAELSIASLATMAAAAVASLLLVVAAWLCLVAAGVWFAVENGMSFMTAFLLAGAINIAAVVALFLWSRSLMRNIGFARTRRLVFPESR
jgi:uncharacterized membrane protein